MRYTSLAFYHRSFIVGLSLISLSHLLEDFAIGLQLVLLTEELARAQAVSLGEVLRGILKHLIQCVHALAHRRHQPLGAVQRPVGSGRPSAHRARLDPLGAALGGPGASENVPGQEGDDGIDPHHRAVHLQQQWTHVLLHLHDGGGDDSDDDDNDVTCRARG